MRMNRFDSLYPYDKKVSNKTAVVFDLNTTAMSLLIGYSLPTVEEDYLPGRATWLIILVCSLGALANGFLVSFFRIPMERSRPEIGSK